MSAILLSGVAAAATLTVDTTADANDPNDGVLDLREALATAGAGDTVTFDAVVFPTDVGPTPIVILLGTLDVTTDDLVVAGEGRVALDGSQAAAGVSALRIEADGVRVTGIRIEEFFTTGIRIEGGVGNVIGEDVPGGKMEVADTDATGIWVGDPTTTVSDVTIIATVSGACASATGACAGIMIKGAGGVSDVTIIHSEVVDTKAVAGPNQGSGILIATGTGHLIEDTTVGIGAGNRAHGIAIMGAPGPITATVVGSTIGENVGQGIHLGPGSASCVIDGNLIGVLSSGDPAGNQQNGVSIFGSDRHVIRNNVISDNGMSGIRMAGASGGNWQSDHTIQGNWIGTTLDGAAAMGNGEYGILSQGQQGRSLIGGPDPGQGNVVSGNDRHGIRLDDGSHALYGNRVGTDVTGFLAVSNGIEAGNWAGIFVDGPLVNVGSGGDRYVFLPEDLGSMNQVSGNIGDGIHLRSSSNTNVRGNLVGAAADGDAPLGNTGHGIVAVGHQIQFEIGDVDTSGRNIVLDNGGDGIRLESSNNSIDFVLVHHNLVGRGGRDDPKPVAQVRPPAVRRVLSGATAYA